MEERSGRFADIAAIGDHLRSATKHLNDARPVFYSAFVCPRPECHDLVSMPFVDVAKQADSAKRGCTDHVGKGRDFSF